MKSLFRKIRTDVGTVKEAFKEGWSQGREHNGARKAIAACVDQSLCFMCRHFIVDFLSKSVWAFDGRLPGWKRVEDQLDYTFTTSYPILFSDDLSTTKCELCRMLVHGWRQTEAIDEGRDSSLPYSKEMLSMELKQKMYLDIRYIPSVEFHAISRFSRRGPGFRFSSDAHGTKWLDEWLDNADIALRSGYSVDVEGRKTRHTMANHQSATAEAASIAASDSTSEFLEQNFITAPRLLPDLDSPEVLGLVKSWADECTSSHEQCMRRDKLPTRVVDVGDGRHPPRLYLSQGEIKPYTALSYCWGRKQSTVLRRENCENFQLAIPDDALPKTISDAIKITRAIGVRYIWIDALCIIQDDADDWQRESVQMGEIYAGSHVTIAGAEAISRHTGLFEPRAVRISSKPFPCGSHMYITRSEPDSFLKRTELHVLQHRGWALQEQLLSTAVVHFTADALMWECRQKGCLEDNGGKDGTFAIHPTLKAFQLSTLEKLPESASKSLWYHIIQNYTERRLTRETDRLIALAGLASMCQTEKWQQGCYLAGLWEGDLPAALLWARAREGIDDNVTRLSVPSWSWASLNLPDKVMWPGAFQHGIPALAGPYDSRLESFQYGGGRDNTLAHAQAALCLVAYIQELTPSLVDELWPDRKRHAGETQDFQDKPIRDVLSRLWPVWRVNSNGWHDDYLNPDESPPVTCQFLMDHPWDPNDRRRKLYLARICSWAVPSPENRSCAKVFYRSNAICESRTTGTLDGGLPTSRWQSSRIFGGGTP
ncbi:uncharacterized protein PV07_11378 [Cladophialophora immunda]|uniref:Heterokaryon incompatibility domain-containing protein n=1 Tax=Cladophialophora immunda TaxID=569365 RepID=A0A0D2BVR0_9EURO|nr:uncharacterized protein PV07_11378 [Cladophialophora immunda]KIW23158.1 hypothetical protein PV07_11378 [Cladophialophora immunda]